MRRRLTGSPIKLTLAAAYLLSAILFNGLQLAWMGLADSYDMPMAPMAMAHAMPDGTPCDEMGSHHNPGQPHCPVCLVAVSPGLVAAVPVLWAPLAVSIGLAEIPAAVSAAPGPVWSPQSARAPPTRSFA